MLNKVSEMRSLQVPVPAVFGPDVMERLFVEKDFAKHIRTHTGVKPYVCKYVDQDGVSCNKEYKRKETLKVHQRNHTGEKIKYKCAHCPQTFTTRQGKYYHEKRKLCAGSSADNEAVK
uniref:C2H2-type domain-containing protein n=1 Tax=Meloidogyne incognita TaxID=6306 RepID=A0A914NN98_MELIC